MKRIKLPGIEPHTGLYRITFRASLKQYKYIMSEARRHGMTKSKWCLLKSLDESVDYSPLLSRVEL